MSTITSLKNKIEAMHASTNALQNLIAQARADLLTLSRQTQDFQPDKPATPTVAVQDWVQTVIDRHNFARRQYQRVNLKASSKLMQMAQAHSEDQKTHAKMGHRGSDGSDLRVRAARVGYVYYSIGENVAMTSGDPLPLWWRSAGHRNNWLNSIFTEIGVGRAGSYWTVVFGRPR